MSEFPTTPAEAAAQAAGYLFQIKFALFRALKRLLRDPTGSIAIERVDDVAISSTKSAGAPAVVEIEQLKHTTDPSTILGDSSPAVWRTLGNWSRLIGLDTHLNLAVLDLILITNAALANDSGISNLGLSDDDRNPSAAFAKLTDAALSSQNKATEKDRLDFLSLAEPIRLAMLRAIRVAQSSPNLAALGSEIEDLLHYACEAGQLSELPSRTRRLVV